MQYLELVKMGSLSLANEQPMMCLEIPLKLVK